MSEEEIIKQNQSLQNDSASVDAIEEMIGLGQENWQGIDPDLYVKALREDWA